MLSLSNHNQTPVIDFHCHAFPDEIAAKALQALFSDQEITPTTDGTARGLEEKFEKDNIDIGIMQPVATKPSQVKSINDIAAKCRTARLRSFGAIHPDMQDPVEEIERIIKLGIPGIKIHGNWQNFFIDDEAMFPVYEACCGKVVILFHAGLEIAPIDQDKATPSQIANVCDNFPSLTVVAAHMGGYKMWDEVEKHLLGRNMYFDTSAASEFEDIFPRDMLLHYVEKHGADRIVFGTDAPHGNPSQAARKLVESGLSDNDLEKIFWSNAKYLLGNYLPDREEIENIGEKNPLP